MLHVNANPILTILMAVSFNRQILLFTMLFLFGFINLDIFNFFGISYIKMRKS